MEKNGIKSDQGHHECEILKGKMPEAAESAFNWKHCAKNPNHEKFICAQDYKDNYLSRVEDEESREKLRLMIDLTVRLKVGYISADRPDYDDYSQFRGSSMSRWATGFIYYVDEPEINTPCPFCVECDGKKAKKHWRFIVFTAHHVVFNSEEAKKTKVDLFLDDESCAHDGRMKSLWGVGMMECYPQKDLCYVECGTCDEDLGDRVRSAFLSHRNWDSERDFELYGKDLMPFCDRDIAFVLIVSHPHGQPKKITEGEWRGKDYPRKDYTTPTCPGSSGAPVFRLRYTRDTGVIARLSIEEIMFSHVHTGSYDFNGEDGQLNFGFHGHS